MNLDNEILKSVIYIHNVGRLLGQSYYHVNLDNEILKSEIYKVSGQSFSTEVVLHKYKQRNLKISDTYSIRRLSRMKYFLVLVQVADVVVEIRMEVGPHVSVVVLDAVSRY